MNHMKATCAVIKELVFYFTWKTLIRPHLPLPSFPYPCGKNKTQLGLFILQWPATQLNTFYLEVSYTEYQRDYTCSMHSANSQDKYYESDRVNAYIDISSF